MINRRHIRVKVMQSVYAMIQSNSADLITEEKFLRNSIDKMYDLYVLSLDLIVKVNQLAAENVEQAKKKYFATKEELNPNTKFINNLAIAKLKQSSSLATYIADNQLNNWYLDDKYVIHIYEALLSSNLYAKYMADEETSFNKDVKFLVKFFSQIIAPEEKLEDYYEGENLTWVDDLPFVNTWVVNTLKDLNESHDFVLNRLYKNEDDKGFVSELFKKVILNHKKFENDIDGKTPNWDQDRIADLDMILIKMAICEFLKFPSIPVKATINEYLEIAKDYSTEKSSVFINGVLDKLWRSYDEQNLLNKIGRGKI